MARQKSVAPAALPAIETELAPFALPDLTPKSLEPNEAQYLQRGGRSEAVALFSSFVGERGRNYSFDMSSPLSAATSCSRLSPHFSFGTLSLREVVQKCRKLLKNKDLSTAWKRALRSFDSRLHWHCHFIQKLELSRCLKRTICYKSLMACVRMSSMKLILKRGKQGPLAIR